MAPALIAQGNALDISQLGSYQDRFPENSEGYLDIELRWPLVAELAGWLDKKLEDLGVAKHRVEVRDTHLLIFFKTEVAPLVLIAAAAAASLVIFASVVSWKLYQLPAAVGVSMSFVFIIIIVAVAAYAAIVIYGGASS